MCPQIDPVQYPCESRGRGWPVYGICVGDAFSYCSLRIHHPAELRLKLADWSISE